MSRDNSSESNEPWKRRSFMSAAGATALVGTAGCVSTGDSTGNNSGDSGGSDSSSKPVIFGQPAGLTGKWNFLQKPVNRASDLTIKKIDEAGGPLDRGAKLIRRDTGVNPQQAREVIQQLVNNDNAATINGGFSSEIVGIFDFLQELEAPIVTPWPGTRFLNDKGGDKKTPKDLSDDEWVWRTIIGDSVHTAGAALKSKDEGAKRVAVLNGTSGGERSWASGYIDAVNVIDGLELAKQIEVSEGKSSYSSEIDRLFQSDFDMWALSVGFQDAVTIIREWANGGYGRKLILEDGLKQNKLIKELGDNIPNNVWLTTGSSSGPVAEKFNKMYQEEYGDKELNPWGVASYDAINVSALAIHKAGSTDHSKIEKNIGEVTRKPGKKVNSFAEGKKALDNGEKINYNGALSNVDFTEDGNVVAQTQVWNVSKAGFEKITKISTDRIRKVLTDSEYGK